MNSFVALLALAMVAYAHAGVVAGPTLLSAPGVIAAPALAPAGILAGPTLLSAPLGLRAIHAPVLAAPALRTVVAGPTLLHAPAAIGVKSIAAPGLLAAPIIAG